MPRPDRQSYSIRTAVAADAAELATLRWRHRDTAAPDTEFAGFASAFSAWLDAALATNRWRIAVAEDDAGSLIACMYLERIAKVPDPGKVTREWGYVTSSYVEREWRNRGIGGALLAGLIGWSEKMGLEFLLLWPSADSIPFYQRSGFRPAESFQAVDGDPGPFELRL
jgi:GNAT superfamily N-acetyltransferase